MSANQSYLSDGDYGYDCVVATTQESINETMKQYIATNKHMATVTMYFNQDRKGNPVLVTRDDLLVQTGGVDPLDPSVPAWDGNGDQPDALDFLDLKTCTFWYAFTATIGKPKCYTSATMPDIITLNPGANTVSFKLLCSNFRIVESNYTRFGLGSYISASQPTTVGSDAWMYTATVDLTTLDVKINQISTDPNDPFNGQAVVDQANAFTNKGATAFSIQQLMFDLDNPLVETTPKFTGITPGSTLETALNEAFAGAYFSTMQESGAPILGYKFTMPTAPDTSSLVFSNIDLEADALLDGNDQAIPDPTDDQKKLATLNYLCTTNGKTPKTVNHLPWNWVENDTELGDFDGVVAVNRNTLANYFSTALMRYARPNCFLPTVKVTLDDASEPVYEFSMAGGQLPTIAFPKTGQTVLTISWNPDASSDQAGVNGNIGQASMQPSFNLSVDFTGNTIVITQHLKVNVSVSVHLSSDSGNVIDVTKVDTYTLSIDPSGKLLYTPVTVTTDNSQSPKVNVFINFFTGLNELIGDITTWLTGFVETHLTDIPLSTAQDFIFPAGSTFTFSDVNFSDHQDLVGHVKYIKIPINA